MKTLSLGILLGLISMSTAFALPVLNKNTPGAEDVTVFPDHADPNLYYLAPTVFVVSKTEQGVPNFSYMEFRTNGTKHAIVQSTLKPSFSYASLEAAKVRIRGINPNAQFTALPFEKSEVNFVGSLKPLVWQSDCQHAAGTVGDEQTCAFELNRQGIRVMRPMLKKGLTITTQFVYSVNGVQQDANGSYTNQENTYQVAGRIGDRELASFPELFHDANGEVIKDALVSVQDSFDW